MRLGFPFVYSHASSMNNPQLNSGKPQFANKEIVA